MNARDRVPLRHMRDAARDARTLAHNRTRADLDTDLALPRALVWCITVIGEAASQLSPEGRAALPELPWASIVGMRNRLVHGYYEIQLDRVWDVVIDDLPPLIAALEAVLAQETDRTPEVGDGG